MGRPLFGLLVLEAGVTAVRQAWADAGRSGEPRVVTGRYFSLGPNADAVADEYVRHYYGDEYFPFARGDTLTSPQQVQLELDRRANVGTTDVVLYPSSADLAQVELLGDAVGPRLTTNRT